MCSNGLTHRTAFKHDHQHLLVFPALEYYILKWMSNTELTLSPITHPRNKSFGPSSLRGILLRWSYLHPKLINAYLAIMDDMHLPTLPQTDHDTSSSNIHKPSPLQSLPGEIRNKIWRMLLTTPYAFQEPTSEEYGCEAHYELATAILAVNHQIHDETHRILREENKWIFVCISMPKTPFHYVVDTVTLPVVSRSVLIDTLKMADCYLGMQAYALNVFLSPVHGLLNDENEFLTMIMGPESLPYLLQWIFAMLYTHKSVTSPPTKDIQLNVGYPVCFTRQELQKEVLEPFLVARGAKGTFVNGNVDNGFASSLMAKMRLPFDRHYTDLLGFSKAYLEKGDTAAAAGLTKAASFLYEQGNDFTFFAGQSSIDTHQPFHSHVYESETIGSMLTAIDIRWGKTLLKLRCYADVQRLVAAVLGRLTQTPSQTTVVERIRLVLYCALASLGLGETARFSQIMRRLFQGTCDLGGVPMPTGSTADLTRQLIFCNKWNAEGQKVIIENLDELVSYCKDGEEGLMRCVDIGDFLPDQTQIEFPVAKAWSATATRYERRREKWARNLSVTSLI